MSERGSCIGLALAVPCAAASLSALVACRSIGGDADAAATASASQPAPVASVAAPPAPPPPPSPVDELFRRYRDKLPPAETVSQQNGGSVRCDHHTRATYTLLEMAAGKVPIETDGDVARVVPWSRDADPCLRQIALEAILRKISYESARLSVPDMHETDHFQFHDILSSAKTWLDGRQVTYDEKVFDGLMLEITDAQFASWMKGRWQEVISKGHNFQYLVTFDGAELRVTHDRTEPDPERPVSTSRTRIAQVRVNDKRQWVVSVAWSEESSSRGFQGKRVEPSDRVYSFWPVSEDVVWFDNAQPGSWKQLRRSK